VDAVGDAFTLIAPEEQKQLTAIERFLGRAIPRVILPDFDYKRRPSEARPAGGPIRGGRPGGQGGGRHSGGGSGGGSHPRGRGFGSGRGPGSSPHSGSANHSQGASSRPSADSSGGPQHGRRPKKSHGMDRRGRRRI